MGRPIPDERHPRPTTPHPINPRHQIVPVVRLTPDEMIEDLADLARFGVGMVDAAHRVGRSVSACERFLYRHGREDLVTRLWAQNPIGSTTPIRIRRRTEREHYATIHGTWAAQVRADATALCAVLAADDAETIAARRAELARESTPARRRERGSA